MNHLWVLGVLLVMVLALAALGMFRLRLKRNEGFQTAAQWVPTTPTAMEGISMNGYTYTDLRITGALFLDKTTATTIRDTMVHTVQMMSDETENVFVVAVATAHNEKLTEIKMVQLTMGQDNSPQKLLTVRASDAAIKTFAENTGPESLTDSVVRDAWISKTASKPVVSSNSGSGYGLQNLIIRIVRPVTGSAATNADQAKEAIARTVSAAQSIMKCPPFHTFFNSANGDSLCCNGTVNPYKHTCEGTTTLNDICTLSGNSRDPRDPTRMLRSCREIVAVETEAAASSCPASQPHLAMTVIDGVEDYKCCANPVVMKDGTNYSCSSEDAKDTARYCVMDGKGVPVTNPVDGKMERMCSEGHMLDTAACPRDTLGRQVFQNVNYVMGEREATRYDINDLKGLTIPTCFRLNETCIPESAIDYAQKRGAYTEYDPKTWEFSCAVWSRKNRGEIVGDSVKGYLANPIGGASGPD